MLRPEGHPSSGVPNVVDLLDELQRIHDIAPGPGPAAPDDDDDDPTESRGIFFEFLIGVIIKLINQRKYPPFIIYILAIENNSNVLPFIVHSLF